MDTIILYGKHELDIYMNPQRQNLIRCMQIAGVPMTPKQLSNQLGVNHASNFVAHTQRKQIGRG